MDDAGQSDGGVERIADDIGEVVLGKALSAGKSVGVQQNDHVQLGDFREERPEPWVVEIETRDIGVDLDSPEAESVDRVFQLGHSGSHVLHRNRCQAHEAVRVAGHDVGQVLVLQPGELPPELGIGPVVELRRRHRDRLNVDAHPVHIGEADRGIGQLVLDLPQVTDLVVIGLLAAEIRERVHPRLHQTVDQREACRGQDMRMQVDGSVGSWLIARMSFRRSPHARRGVDCRPRLGCLRRSRGVCGTGALFALQSIFYAYHT